MELVLLNILVSLLVLIGLLLVIEQGEQRVGTVMVPVRSNQQRH